MKFHQKTNCICKKGKSREAKRKTKKARRRRIEAITKQKGKKDKSRKENDNQQENATKKPENAEKRMRALFLHFLDILASRKYNDSNQNFSYSSFMLLSPLAELSSADSILEDVLHEQSSNETHGGREACSAHSLTL